MGMIFNGQEINHRKMDRCLERRDAEFKQNIAEVCISIARSKSSGRRRRPSSRAMP
jgi:hypothetical protein